MFALSLLASGLSSASVGTMAGQVIMQGFLHGKIPVWMRRLVTMVPSLIVIAIGLDPTRTLVISQVVLSFGLPFAIIPLAMFTSRRSMMGVLVNSRLTTILVSASRRVDRDSQYLPFIYDFHGRIAGCFNICSSR